MVPVRSFKLRFFDEHVRIAVGDVPGVDVRGAEARACFALAAPMLDWLLARAPGATVRALSVDLGTRRVLVSLQGQVLRIQAPDSTEIVDRAAPLVERLTVLATGALARRSKTAAD